VRDGGKKYCREFMINRRVSSEERKSRTEDG